VSVSRACTPCGALLVACLGWLAGCGSGPPALCPDDGDPAGPACRTWLETGTQYEALSVGLGAFPNPERGTKVMVPASSDPDLLPPLFQNLNRYEIHLEFLKALFPERFQDLDAQGYLDMILARATRQYFAGNLYRFSDPAQGALYGFTVWTLSEAGELLEPDEVRAIHARLARVFRAGELYYTFDASDTAARQKAAGWVDPGFPIYFP
jgi:hypothetical protein